MFNGENVFKKIVKGLGKGLSKLWERKEEIASDAIRGFKGFVKGYRSVRDNAPWYASGLLKVSMTAVEMGLTSGVKNPLLKTYYDILSGTVMDTYNLSLISYGTSKVVEHSGYDNRWFKW